MNNFKLTGNFDFFELSKTKNKTLLEQNRILAQLHLPTLKDLAALIEKVRLDKPFIITSGYRCPSLNSTTSGSSSKSQHTLGQAVDGYRPDMDHDDAFTEIREKLVNDKIPFGQLIKEEAKRSYGVAKWIHLSLGPGYRPLWKCGQILTMKDGHYNMVERVHVDI